MVFESVITCPHCATAKSETMATDACRFFYLCPGCGVTLRPKHGDCCVLPMQAARVPRRGLPLVDKAR